MDYNEILSKLRSGEDAESIAKEFTDALNAANDDYEKEQSKKTASLQAKRACVNDILYYVKELFEYYDIGNFFQLNVSVDEIVEMLDEAMPTIKTYCELFKALDKNNDKCCDCKSDTNYNDPIKDFLSKYVN